MPAIVLMLLAACSPKRLAVNVVGNAISGETSVYLSDNDPDLVREAIPFGLKTYESLLEVSPRHRGLLLSAASGFVSYAYLLSLEADRTDADDYDAAQSLRERAKKLYLRGRDFALRGLALKIPDFAERLKSDPDAALAATEERDVPFLYWAAASWAGALSAGKTDTALIADLPLSGKMMARVIELDPEFNDGAAYEFLTYYEGTRPGGDAAKAREHFAKALAISNGARASVFLALAEGVAVNEQNADEFLNLLERTSAVDEDAAPDNRLVNVIAKRRAAWLRERMPDLFLDLE
ncbi:MAG TPA: TRAP transporter TatT component family protein [Sphingomonadales bacterium]|nr:TRAP transporter TatT component family protein [Sphingomonadales bacterium]